MRRAGVDVTLVSPRRWNEGGAVVSLEEAEEWVVPARTLGRHPYLFVYNPLPIARLLLTQRFDVIDVHEEPGSLAALELRLLAWLRHRRTPMLMYSAQNLDKRYPWPFRWIERATLRRIGGLYPCNADAGRLLRSRGLKGNVRVIPLGVDVGAFRPEETPNRAGHFTIGYLGRLNEQKGVQVVIRCLPLLSADFTLSVVGDGPYRIELEALALELGVSDRVSFTGFASHGDVVSALRRFDVLAVPSLTRPNVLEQFGRVVVEGMASGIPVVVSSVGALPETGGEAVLVVDEDNPEALADAVQRVASDEALRRRLIEAGMVRALEFDWQEVARRHVDLYHEVLR